ncbi:tRNA 5-methoxyuridine(34)/uridine 5-oxyacetic acid(34) synthase CmoB [Marinobacter sp. MDS2]|uniref:tRNA 5-methoxyuridine(34)/uridine 5-oxyacetic acid(34) synthase CmoB n=1 Tax=Marinobacter sp. MDS2 TaxID=3065961 RepID=UPI00273B6BF7|nr:tRNA 5-methoxyuridine(34)/uridine 5-oxyacetic acid(34) synthase CmoB [Marinobacter sp. MDS2]MDP4546983.1 tRNA 5-methoxyuridine(34)/uridine 5-oxyacetic acid(34) synthase CmoB [Marinobacter sp. MDS2]
MSAFDWREHFSPFIDSLNNSDQAAWAEVLKAQLIRRFEDNPHGDMARWHAALQSLPSDIPAKVDLNSSAVSVTSEQPLSEQDAQNLELGLRGLMPWRKGPFNFFGTHVDTEWRSDWKWERVSPHLADLQGRTILDVGCGSGYHCWRMAGAGARQVVGIDPGLLFMFQFLAVKGYLGDVPVDLLPIRMEDLPANLEHFDTTFSMGVLYHRRSPIDHLLDLKGTLRRGGELVLETLVVDGPEGFSLMPEDRYGQMRNVWFLPSCPTLIRWLERAGFRNARVVDVSDTTTEEQRQTDWMRFNSLADFLDPNDPTKTIEGYPGPKRATLIAEKP